MPSQLDPALAKIYARYAGLPGTTRLVIRCPQLMLDDLDELAAQKREETGLRVSRSAMVRLLVLRGLAENLPL